MKVLVFAEQREGRIKKSSCEAVHAARALADQLGGQCIALVAGSGIAGSAGELGTFGAARVLAVDSPALARHSNTAVAKVIAGIAAQEGAEIVILSASQMGKDIAPRVAIKLKAGLASDCTALTVTSGEVVATRPVYAGKALTDVKVKTPVKVFTLRPNVFTAAASGSAASVERREVALEDTDFASVVTALKVASGRPDVTEADIIVSGGRGMKGPEHFHLIEELADVLGAGVGASRDELLISFLYTIRHIGNFFFHIFSVICHHIICWLKS